MVNQFSFPDPNQGRYGDQERPATGGDSKELEPRKGHRGWIAYAIVVVLVGVLALLGGYRLGYDDRGRDDAAKAAASQSADAARQPPANLRCPNPNSEEYQKADRSTFKIVTEPPTTTLTVVAAKTTVIVRAKITNDIVICGNDSNLVLEVPVADSARILMQGGHDPGQRQFGPAIFLVNGTTRPNPDRVWFSNHTPVYHDCYSGSPSPGELRASCSLFFSTTPPSPPPSPPAKPSPTTTKK